MSFSEWAAVAVSCVSLLGACFAVLKVAFQQGQSAQRQDDLEKRMGAAEGKIDQLEQAVASVPVILEKINGLDRMMTRDLDEVKHALRNLQMGTQSRRRSAGGTA